MKRHPKHEIRVRRIYEPPSPDDGFRVLVDRLWPRGIRKETAKLDLWLRTIAPSPELRKGFCHDPEKWLEFRRRYFKELSQNRDALAPLIDTVKHQTVTLLYAAREERFNNAVALKDYLKKKT